jgi:hypothetical protein
MTPSGMAFMALSWGLVLFLFAFSFYKLFSKG